MSTAAETAREDEPPATARARGPARQELEHVSRLKYGPAETHGWGPRMRSRFGYYTPDDFYEALVDRLVGPGCTWLDVGCGRDVFPTNRPLAQALAARCGLLVGVDPDETLEENPFVHERVRGTIDDLRTDRTFDIVTLRMVAEHITNPAAAAASLGRLTRPGGMVVIYTVNRWTPVALAAGLVPFGLHHAIKKVLWGTEEKDTFPVAYLINTRGALARLFRGAGFDEVYFSYLDDCRTFGLFRMPHYLELSLWRALRAVRLRYPENCLLGVYRRCGDAGAGGLSAGRG